MDDLAQQRVTHNAKGVMPTINRTIEDLFVTAARNPTASEQLDTLLKVELAKIGCPLDTDIGEPMFLMGFVIGRIMSRGATRDQVMAFLANVIDESTKIEEEILLPNVTLTEQLRWSRMLSGQIWELFYAIEESAGVHGAGCKAKPASAEDQWVIASDVARFIVEFQMLMLRSR